MRKENAAVTFSRRLIVALAFQIAWSSFAATAPAERDGISPVEVLRQGTVHARRPCTELPVTSTFAAIPGVPARLTSATLVAAKYPYTEYCDVKGYVVPQIQFELRLPTSWNGRYLQGGSGRLAGEALASRDCGVDVALELGFATGFSYGGQIDAALDGPWAVNDRQVQLDLRYRSPHALAVAAKAITAAFYGERPHHAYFDGCSEGGREALSEAQRYPDDFDGVIAISPDLRPVGRIHNAVNPDLSAFRDHGGKLLLLHGWADPAIPPTGTLDYYAAVQDRMGGLDAVQTFARLFMFPGTPRCTGSEICSPWDLIGPIVSWVEEGTPPDRIVFTQAKDGTATRTRSLLPYPMPAAISTLPSSRAHELR
jgi:hypothetical protein